MTKYKNHPWPTDGATRKYVDRANDKLILRLDRISKTNRELKRKIVLIEEFLSVGPHARAYEMFLAQKEK